MLGDHGKEEHTHALKQTFEIGSACIYKGIKTAIDRVSLNMEAARNTCPIESSL